MGEKAMLTSTGKATAAGDETGASKRGFPEVFEEGSGAEVTVGTLDGIVSVGHGPGGR
ncbi:hypothetical protein [Phaffia rhodozyma]|uniref:Uncharacterized protein n=1 Tax=Phaffia rhodozyma TaxID=264483 RepID=A0A0F7SLS2_PHARH|nr:hypothetical protein [Phaffia rhodozyma]